MRSIIRLRHEEGLALLIRFDDFTLDPETGELRKGGALVKLKPQPAQVLALLASRAGAVVTRDEIQKALWQDETHVDFDLGINSCIRQIRIALDDDAESPRFVQTLSKRGYRFLATDEKTDAIPLRPKNVRWALAALAIAVAGTALWAGWRSDRPTDAPRIVRTSLNLPPDQALHFTTVALALSPDGTRLVYRGLGGLFLRSLGEDEIRRIDGTEGAANPFFSPDGHWIGFQARDNLMKARLDGSGAAVISDAGIMRGADWAPDGTIVYSQLEGLMKVPATGGAPVIVTRVDFEAGERFHRFPDVLPDGRGVIFSVVTGAMVDESDIVVESFETGERKVLVKASHARYVPTGHLVYARENTLYAMPFDIERLEVRGTGIPVVTDVLMNSSSNGAAQFTISETGALVHATAPRIERRLVLVDLDGRVQPLAAPALPYVAARFSPDGRRLAVTAERTGGGTEVYSYELAQERLSLVVSRFDGPSEQTFTPWWGGVAWHPGGRHLVLDATTPGEWVNLFMISVDGSGSAERLTDSPYEARVPGAWSASSGGLVYSDIEYGRTDNWAIAELLEDGSVRVVVDAEAGQSQPSLSPDGQWMAYKSLESGLAEVYVMPYEGEGRTQVSRDGGHSPVWAPDGRTLYYRSGDRMMAAGVTTAPELAIDAPRLLFERRDLFATGVVRTGDIAPDGNHFVMIQGEGRQPTELKIVLDWFHELRQLVPAE